MPWGVFLWYKNTVFTYFTLPLLWFLLLRTFSLFSRYQALNQVSDFKSKDYGWTENMHMVLAIYELKGESIQINIKNNLPIIQYIIYISYWSVCVREIILKERVSGERKCKIHFLNCDQKLMFKCRFAFIFKEKKYVEEERFSVE